MAALSNPEWTSAWWDSHWIMVWTGDRWESARVASVDPAGHRILGRLRDGAEEWLEATSFRLTWEGRVPSPRGGRHASGCWRCRSTAPAVFDVRCPVCGSMICGECGACGSRCSVGR